MESLEPKKLALIRIWQILQEYSDEAHPLTQEEIAEKLDKEYGIIVERKAIGRNLSLLKEAGFEIESGRNGCYLSQRDFEDSELRLLIDGVISSRYIPANYSKDLIDRICKLSNKFFRSGVQYIHSVDDWSKTTNPALFLNIELIDRAIESGKQIRYDYNKYGVDLQLHKSSQQTVSPYLMLLHNQRYYVMAFNEYWKSISFHRLDHITNMTVLEDTATPIESVPGYENGINYRALASGKPYMYSDTPEKITFRADRSIVDQIVDWFGSEVTFSKDAEDQKVLVSIIASPNAMEHWASQYLGHVEILFPDSLRQKMKESLKRAIEKYE